MPKLAANSISVSRSPIMKLRVLSIVSAAMNSRTMPISGLRQSQPSRLKCGQMNTASNSIPCELNNSRMNRCARSKFSCGKPRGPESVLIRDHDEGETRGLELEQRRHDRRA